MYLSRLRQQPSTFKMLLPLLHGGIYLINGNFMSKFVLQEQDPCSA
jgi:hypothetical protein